MRNQLTPLEVMGSVNPLPATTTLAASNILVAPTQYLAIAVVDPVVTPASSTAVKLIGPFEDFTSVYSGIVLERQVLQQAVSNLWNLHRYNQHYIGFLGGGVSRADFQAAVEKYATTPIYYEAKFLRAATDIIIPFIQDDELTARDVAVGLNAEPDQLELALEAASC